MWHPAAGNARAWEAGSKASDAAPDSLLCSVARHGGPHRCTFSIKTERWSAAAHLTPGPRTPIQLATQAGRAISRTGGTLTHNARQDTRTYLHHAY